MLSRLVVCVATWAALVGFPREASPHPAPFSFLDLVIRDRGIEGTLVLHVVDVAHELRIEPADRLLDPRELEAARSRLIALMDARMRIRTEGSGPTTWLGIEPSTDRHAVLLEFRVPSDRPGSVAIFTRMFPYDPVHQTFINIYEGEELRQQMIVAADGGERVYFTGSRQGALAVIRTFVPAGIHHILIGPDHVLFLIGLLLLGGGWAALVKIVTAFTLGHSLTLSLAALNIITPPARVIEPAIALSIIFVGADNLVRGTGRDVRGWAALVFGLVHGFGFANVLREFGLPSQALGWSLFSFNLGVEIGQLAIVLVVTTALLLVRKRSPRVSQRLARFGSMVVVAAGAYWFVERVFITPPV
jgi:hypothetical protein